MIQRRERLRHAFKSGYAFGVCGECVRQDLDRDLATRRRVGRSVHLSHPALANLRGDFVDAEAGTGAKANVGVSE
jgi:hypothetical protein